MGIKLVLMTSETPLHTSFDYTANFVLSMVSIGNPDPSTIQTYNLFSSFSSAEDLLTCDGFLICFSEGTTVPGPNVTLNKKGIYLVSAEREGQKFFTSSLTFKVLQTHSLEATYAFPNYFTCSCPYSEFDNNSANNYNYSIPPTEVFYLMQKNNYIIPYLFMDTEFFVLTNVNGDRSELLYYSEAHDILLTERGLQVLDPQ